ncbi:hypothetical protein RFN57_00090 [Streptomyces violaceochromogenes]|uniref:Uncharacterized protein n=1 Tax=Streptomyces violaceochromogenes TaxID=67377 RepID=A0ABU6LMJ6_9ACTN|nr:hypothetical protein [Streptomyces violaceochromogenes]MEC7050734.1 hypothetical protein [Streptomyces violaceochromogenes]
MSPPHYALVKAHAPVTEALPDSARARAAKLDVYRAGDVPGGELGLLPHIDVGAAVGTVGGEESGRGLGVAVSEPGGHAAR